MESHIYVHDRHICDASGSGGNNGFEGATVMVESLPRNNYFIQSGYVRECTGSNTKHCYQAFAYSDWNNGPMDCCHVSWGPNGTDFPLNRYQTYNFKVEKRYAPNLGTQVWYMTFNVLGGGEVVINSVRDSAVSFPKDNAYYFGETHTGYTYMAGSTDSKVLYDQLRWRNGDTWYSPVLTCRNQGGDANYHNDCNDGDYTFRIWDSR